MTKQKAAGFEASLLWKLALGAWSLFSFWYLVIGYCLSLHMFLDKLLHVGWHRGLDFYGHAFYRMNEFDPVGVQ